jgi:hypothetical protein
VAHHQNADAEYFYFGKRGQPSELARTHQLRFHAETQSVDLFGEPSVFNRRRSEEVLARSQLAQAGARIVKRKLGKRTIGVS